MLILFNIDKYINITLYIFIMNNEELIKENALLKEENELANQVVHCYFWQ